MSEIDVHDAQVAGLPVRWRTAPGVDPPILWLHGVPQSSEMWTPFLERAGGLAVDLPGFGRSGKPAGFDYSIAGYSRFLWGERDPFIPARFADALAAALPDARVERLAGAGHWPWLDRPEAVELIAGFVSE